MKAVEINIGVITVHFKNKIYCRVLIILILKNTYESYGKVKKFIIMNTYKWQSDTVILQ